jgi:hypothetical protein
MTYLTPVKISRKILWLWGGRLLALGFAVFGSWYGLKHSSAYMDWSVRRCAWHLYTFDLYHDAHYTTNSVEKIVLLSDGRLLVGFPSESGEYKFEIRLLDNKK